MDFLKIVELLATVTSIVGIIYITIPKRTGLYYLIIGTIFWGVFAVLSKSWFLLSQEIFLIVLNIISLKTWKDKGIDL